MNVHFNTTLFSFLCVTLITLLTHPAAPTIPNDPTLAKHAAAKPGDDPFDRLALEAARRYKQSSDEKKEEPKPEEPAPAAPEAKPEDPAQKGWFDFLRKKNDTPKSDPILAKHKEFSDDWWDALFVPCNGCKKEDSDKKIDCKQLLEANPQWKEVKPMSQQAKDIITQRALRRFTNMDDACSFACAICSEGNPDTRLDGREPHTALHVSTGGFLPKNRHYGIFNLLLRYNANVNLRCMPVHPLDFGMPDSWEHELKAHGSRKS